MKAFDYVVMHGLVKVIDPASELYHGHKSALKTAGPKAKGNLRQFATECERQAYKATYNEVRDKPEYEQVRTRYDKIYDRIERSHQHRR